MQFADIILPLNIAKPLTYGVPIQWQETIKPGMRVEVSMGKNKVYSGIVWKIHNDTPAAYQVKPIRNLVDDEPILTKEQMMLWDWVADYYMASLGEVMQAALPAYLKLMNEALLIWDAEDDAPLPDYLSDDAYIVAEALSIRKKLTIAEIRMLLEERNTTKAVQEVLNTELAIVQEQLEERYKPKKDEIVLLNEKYNQEKELNELVESLQRAPKQLQVLLTYFQFPSNSHPLSSSLLLKKAKASRSQLLALVEKNIFRLEKIEVDRLQFVKDKPLIKPELSEVQQVALTEIQEAWQQQQVVLLHGVTGSGKTLIYVQLIADAITQGKQVLFLLPEIALTTQLVMRLRSYFGEELGVYHSKFSNNERVEIWNKVKEGQYKVIVGARSAVWLPFQHLDKVIVDEEHEFSYKQYDPAPRFHARDLAIFLAHLHAAKVLLGSATPSIESTYNAEKKKYGYVRLNKRYRDVSLPTIELVKASMTQASLSSILTTPLLEEIQNTLKQGKQAILFQNKRGYAPFLICGSCGWVAHCAHCDVSLTYHKHSDKLHCHYCGNRSSLIKSCPKCGNIRLSSKSFGTERVEEDLIKIFPKLRIGRMDLDSMKGKNKHVQLLEDFEQGRIDILVGTQMVVKGLDFENVGLVGVLSADSLLSFPDFRVNERAFQLMEQVSGRAGRLDGKGKVMIQAFNLKHPILHWVKDHDFKSFYRNELAVRAQFNYPPFVRLIKISCKHVDEKKVSSAIELLARQLNEIPEIHLQGPAPALIPRVRNQYIHELWLKMPNERSALIELKAQVAIAVNNTMTTRGFSAVRFSIDVDPY